MNKILPIAAIIFAIGWLTIQVMEYPTVDQALVLQAARLGHTYGLLGKSERELESVLMQVISPASKKEPTQ